MASAASPTSTWSGPCPLSAGGFGIAGEEGRRLLRVLSFVQHRPTDHPWAHPVDGVVAYVDLIEGRSSSSSTRRRCRSRPRRATSTTRRTSAGRARPYKPYRDHPARGPELHRRRRRRPGRGGRCGWASTPAKVWCCTSSRCADRPIIYRASVAEMVVPYADPARAVLAELLRRGEYLLGQQANSLSWAATASATSPTSTRCYRRRRRAADRRERDLHARGGLRHAVEALRPLHRLRQTAGSGGWSSRSS